MACVLFGVKVLRPQKSSGLSGGIWPFGVRLGNHCYESRKQNMGQEVTGQLAALGWKP